MNRSASPRVACDSLVALRTATTGGNVLFAKNSDRPARECQPLALLEATRPAASRVRCQYIEIPQVESTLRVLGSRPYWLWGLEHGVNEAGVAIGNHTVFTRDKPQGEKLIGMDLVRLGLERGGDAGAAIDTITTLVERYGQGGSGYADSDFPYHSSFLVADRNEAFLLETSDRRWALRQIQETGSATNHLTIGDDWHRLSPDAERHAEAAGWWAGKGARFDFAAAYRDVSFIPPTFSSGRLRRSRELLEGSRGAVSEASMRLALRDHYGSQVYRDAYSSEDERYLSLCMHADPIGATTAAAVVRLPATANQPLRYSACFGPPCAGVFIPLYVEGELPKVLTAGGAENSPTCSPWWGFRELLDLIERDHERLGGLVRDEWDRTEKQLFEEADRVEAALPEQAAVRAELLSGLMDRTVRLCLERLGEIRHQISS